MYNHILLPIDLSESSSWEKALPTALYLCKNADAKLHLLTVLPDFGMTIVGQYFPKGYEEEMAAKALESLHKFVREHVPEDIHVQHIIGEGSVYEIILKTADDINADIIVMGSHRPELKDYLLGPNAARVVRHANCSVMVVRD